MNKMATEPMTGTATAEAEAPKVKRKRKLPGNKNATRNVLMLIVPALLIARRRLLLADQRRQRVDRRCPDEAGHRLGQRRR